MVTAYEHKAQYQTSCSMDKMRHDVNRMSVMGGELALGAERKSSEKNSRGRKRRTSDCHHTPFLTCFYTLVLMLLRHSFSRCSSPSWISRVPSMPLRAKVTNPAFQATVCTSQTRPGCQCSLCIDVDKYPQRAPW